MQVKLILALSLGLFAISPAMAEVQINGFASIVMGIDLEDDGNPREGYESRTVDALQQSRVALQWSADLDDGMRFVGQTMARGDAADGFVLNYDWAYFDWNVGDSGKFKFGRLRIPFYKYSDYLDVGYAYHWIRPPVAQYGLAFSNLDGVSYQHNYTAAGMDQALNLVLGRYQGSLNIGGVPNPGDLQNFLAINWSATMGDHEFYAAYAQADVYIDSGTIWTDANSNGAVDAGEGIAALATNPSDVLINGDYGGFIGVGYKGSYGDVGVFFEYNVVTIEDSILSDESSGGYLGATYTMGDYTYHLTYEFAENTAPTIAGFAGATVFTEENVAQEGENTGITIGARRDVGSSSAIKVDLTSFTEDDFQGTSAAPEENTALILKVAVETMF